MCLYIYLDLLLEEDYDDGWLSHWSMNKTEYLQESLYLFFKTSCVWFYPRSLGYLFWFLVTQAVVGMGYFS